MNAPMQTFSVETEQSLLGALMLDAKAMQRIEVALEAAHFYRVEHQRIYRAIQSLIDAGRSADPMAVVDALEQAGELPAAGGMAYVVDIFAAAASAAGVKRHAEIIVERAMLRALAAAANDIGAIAEDTGLTVADKVNAAQARIMTLSDSAKLGARDPKSVGELLPEYMKIFAGRREGIMSGVATGYPDLDKRLNGGMGETWVIIIAGRPGMGKTTLALNIAENVAEGGGTVLFCSQEMPNMQLMDRCIASLARIDLDRILTPGEFTNDEYDRLMSAAARLKEMPLLLDEQGALCIEDVARKARQANRAGKLKLIVIDYLQLMVGDGETRNNELTKISGGIKALAKELGIPIIVLSQLNRGLESRPNKRPMPSDLRESGAIEQDADLILAPYRDEVYNPDSVFKGLTELLFLKFRHGKSGGFVPLVFAGNHSRFNSMFGAWPTEPEAATGAPKKRRGFIDE